MEKAKSTGFKVTGIILIGIILAVSWLLGIGTLSFKPDALTNLPSLFGYFLLISIFVERAIEVFLSAWRSSEADSLDRQIARGKGILDDKDEVQKLTPEKVTELKDQIGNLVDERTRYRAKSRSMAQWMGLVFGGVVSMIGVRLLGNLVEAESLAGIQKNMFIIVDVFITGIVLAGGSDAFNRIMKVYNSIMDTTAYRATAKKGSII